MNRFVITIGRRVGAGGLHTAHRLAEELGVKVYDKEILAEVARHYGISTDIVEGSDEKEPRKGLRSIFGFLNVSESYASSKGVLTDEALFNMQSEVIRKIVSEESCIIVGRCADYILRDDPGCVSVFITGDLACRADRLAEQWQCPDYEARQRIEREDRKRAAYYNFFTFKTWGDSASYDLCIDSFKAGGIDNVVEQIKFFMKQKNML